MRAEVTLNKLILVIELSKLFSIRLLLANANNIFSRGCTIVQRYGLRGTDPVIAG